MIELYNNATNQLIGALTEAELQTLIDALEEESQEDQDYYIDVATIDLLADGRATDHLIQLLRTALEGAEGVEIRWQRR
jgi:processive 1,2-diacylglycerol beta-glucosyltransferase